MPHFHGTRIDGSDLVRLSFLTGTDSTTSNLPGHGRTLDRFLTAGGALIDGAVYKALRRQERHGPGSTGPTTLKHSNGWQSLTSSVSDISYSTLTGTDSTASNLRGHGRTLGRLLSFGGASIESFTSAAGQLVGFGPTALMVRMLCRPTLAFKAWDQCSSCLAKHEDERTQLLARQRPTFEDVIDYLLHFVCLRCRHAHQRAILSDTEFKADCERLTAYVRDNNHPHTRRTALLYICALSCLHDKLRNLFQELNMLSVIDQATAAAPARREEDNNVLMDVLNMARIIITGDGIQSVLISEEEELSSLHNLDSIASPQYWQPSDGTWSALFRGLTDPSAIAICAFRLCLIFRAQSTLNFSERVSSSIMTPKSIPLPADLMARLWSRIGIESNALGRHLLVSLAAEGFRAQRALFYSPDKDLMPYKVWDLLWRPMIHAWRDYTTAFTTFSARHLRELVQCYIEDTQSFPQFTLPFVAYISEDLLQLNDAIMKTPNDTVNDHLSAVFIRLSDCVPNELIDRAFLPSIATNANISSYIEPVTSTLAHLGTSAFNVLSNSNLMATLNPITKAILLLVNQLAQKAVGEFLSIMIPSYQHDRRKKALVERLLSARAVQKLSYPKGIARGVASSINEAGSNHWRVYHDVDVEIWIILLWGIRKVMSMISVTKEAVSFSAHVSHYNSVSNMSTSGSHLYEQTQGLQRMNSTLLQLLNKSIPSLLADTRESENNLGPRRSIQGVRRLFQYLCDGLDQGVVSVLKAQRRH